MLLPSALSCENGLPQPKPQRPKLPSFERYDPRQRSQSPVVGLIASCRALHNILGERLSSTTPPVPTTNTPARLKLVTSPFGEVAIPKARPAPPRGLNKRTRDEFESDDEDENNKIVRQPTQRCYHNDLYSTPKRRRRAPEELPPGLLASDFESLEPTTPIAKRKSVELDMPTVMPATAYRKPLAVIENMPERRKVEKMPLDAMDVVPSNWSEEDDKLLVETVLSKLSLSKREWNDCAKRLGKDKDTLGQRWRLLLGGGSVGLRRGTGKMSRTNLEIASW